MAANKERGELPLEVGDTTYILKLTTNAVCQMESLNGRTMDQVLAGMQQGSMSDLRLFLWAMLQAHHPELSLTDVGAIVDDAGGVFGVQQKLEALTKLNTKEAAANGNGRARNPRKARPGTGVSSTSTPVVPV